MKKGILQYVVYGLFVLSLGFLIACGGGGGGVGGTNGGGSGGAIPVAGQYLELVAGGGVVDPLNLHVGDQVQVQFVNYDQVGARTVLSASGYTLTGTGSPNVTLSGTGLLHVSNDPNVNFRVSATASFSGTSATLSQDCRIAQGAATVTGRVMSTNGVTGLVYTQVDIYDVNLNRVGGALTFSNGAFTATCPTSAKWITLKAATIPDAYFRALSYLNKDYSVFGTTCLAALPTLHGGNNPLPGDLIIPRLSDGPPPPPSGCGQ